MRNLIKKILKESEDDFGWATDIVKKEPINVGDVFYIVDRSISVDTHSANYKPKRVRFVLFVTEIREGPRGFKVYYQNCFPAAVSYNPKDYNPIKGRCHYDDGDGYESEIDYVDALDLINQQYWRPMGNNGYYNNLNESEDDFSWVDNLGDEPFHNILLQNDDRDFELKFTKVDRILFNPPVQIGSRHFNDVAFWLEDRDYYPENLDYDRHTSYIEITKRKHADKIRNGRYKVGPVLSDKELYNLSQQNTKPNWNGNIWYEQFIKWFKR